MSAIVAVADEYNRRMRQHLAKLGLSFLVGGCSLIYNSGNIPQKQIDALVVDAPFDANASQLMLTDVSPSTILEGQGDGHSRPAVLVIHGANIVSGAQVTIMGASNIAVDNTQAAVSTDSTMLAVPVTAHVDPGTPSGNPIHLIVQVSQPGATAQSLAGKLDLVPLDELKTATQPADGTVFSQIAVNGPLTVTAAGGSPVILRAVSSISIGAIVARGGDASGSSAGAAGAGASAGGAQVAKGSGNGGGNQGTDGSSGVLGGQGGDGGGGGFAAAGGNGQGTGGGTGGPMYGDDLVSTYASNAPSGGGGGGRNATLAGLFGAGGGGGGGGSVVELTAGGDVTCGTIDVSGGGGAPGGSGTGGGGGGGGAGGVIVLRAGGALTCGMLTASGGAGGAGTQGTQGSGGAGSPGRIRWDSAQGSAPAASPMPLRGPSFATQTPLVVRTNHVALVGAAGKTFNVYVNDVAGAQGLSFDGSGNASVDGALVPGYDHVCAVLPAGDYTHAESRECIDVAYLP